MSDDYRAKVRDAIERAKVRAGNAPPPAPAPENPRDAMQRRLMQQWEHTIGPVLEALQQELNAAGHRVTLVSPGESNTGVFQIDLPTVYEGKRWPPTLFFESASDGSAVQITSTFGEFGAPSTITTHHPATLVESSVTELVLKLVNEGL